MRLRSFPQLTGNKPAGELCRLTSELPLFNLSVGIQPGVFDAIPRFQEDIQGMPVSENSLSGMFTRIDPFLNGSCRPNSNSSVKKKETKDNGNAGLFAAGVMAWDTSDKKTQKPEPRRIGNI